MNQFRKTDIARAILQTLKHAQGYAVPEATLRPQVAGLLRPPPEDAEWTAVTDMLGAREAIIEIPAELDPELIQWAITERGRVLLATL
jgi:hypothetical protein